MQELENLGYREAINKEGLPVYFGIKLSKKKREYTTVTFYPEDKKEEIKIKEDKRGGINNRPLLYL